MTCRNCQLEIPAYVDGALGDVVRERLEAHVRRCRACAAALAGERAALARFPSLLGGAAVRPVLATHSSPAWPAAWLARRQKPLGLLAAAASLLLLAGAPALLAPSRHRPTTREEAPMRAAAPWDGEWTNTLSPHSLAAYSGGAAGQPAVNIVQRISW